MTPEDRERLRRAADRYDALAAELADAEDRLGRLTVDDLAVGSVEVVLYDNADRNRVLHRERFEPIPEHDADRRRIRDEAVDRLRDRAADLRAALDAL